MNEVVLLLGSNLDNRIELLQQAVEMIGTEIGAISNVSSIYETEPWGYESENPFLNQAVLINTTLTPEIVLEKCLAVEGKLGRVRNENKSYSDRSIDIDILLFGSLVVENESLQIPHPRMHQRRFCMEPLKEIVPEMLIPTFGQSVEELYNTCDDNSKIEKLNATV